MVRCQRHRTIYNNFPVITNKDYGERRESGNKMSKTQLADKFHIIARSALIGRGKISERLLPIKVIEMKRKKNRTARDPA
jgi:hypothetical protein